MKFERVFVERCCCADGRTAAAGDFHIHAHYQMVWYPCCLLKGSGRALLILNLDNDDGTQSGCQTARDNLVMPKQHARIMNGGPEPK